MPVTAKVRIAGSAISRAQAANAVRGFFRIMELWRAEAAEARAILGHPPERTFYKWRAGEVGAVPADTIRRIGYVSGIWKALQILYSDPAQADSWVRRPNLQFGGQAPITRMSAGDVTDLAAVRQYLDAARGPWS
ncbi:MAG TPA: MbcA/ParS/Xre antitoxin family protein [Acetobacteraceae bacterium]|nr:MbcA/ParS/Xre antitoxin family protein [Acetobacteraceae bacterium]